MVAGKRGGCHHYRYKRKKRFALKRAEILQNGDLRHTRRKQPADILFYEVFIPRLQTASFCSRNVLFQTYKHCLT